MLPEKAGPKAQEKRTIAGNGNPSFFTCFIKLEQCPLCNKSNSKGIGSKKSVDSSFH